jgi:hypothetical protein
MRPSTSKVSLSNRIIVVSRKPHVNQIRRATKHVKHSTRSCWPVGRALLSLWTPQCTLPPGSAQAVSDAVDFLSTGIWSRSHVCQSVSTMAASQSLVHVSPNQIARYILHFQITILLSYVITTSGECFGREECLIWSKRNTLFVASAHIHFTRERGWLCSDPPTTKLEKGEINS